MKYSDEFIYSMPSAYLKQIAHNGTLVGQELPLELCGHHPIMCTDDQHGSVRDGETSHVHTARESTVM